MNDQNQSATDPVTQQEPTGFALGSVAAQPQTQAAEEDFLAGAVACDLSGEGTCEACQ